MSYRDPERAVEVLERAKCRYVCTLCPVKDMEVCESASLELHCRLHHPNFTYLPCIYCTEKVSVISIQKHIDRHFSNSSQQPYICPYCPLSFESSHALAQHAGAHHEGNSVFHKCGHCDKPTDSPSELATHLSDSCLSLYHCEYPQCFVKSPRPDLVLRHYEKCHGIKSSCVILTRMYLCSWPTTQRPVDRDSSSTHDFCCLICPKCSFGTMYVETFAEHLATCSAAFNHTDILTSLSVTCVLYHCSQCRWITTVKNVMKEHLLKFHPGISESDGIVPEEFTVPVSDDSVGSDVHPSTGELSSTANSGTAAAVCLAEVTSRLQALSGLFSSAAMSSLVSSAGCALNSGAFPNLTPNKPFSPPVESQNSLLSASSELQTVRKSDDDVDCTDAEPTASLGVNLAEQTPQSSNGSCLFPTIDPDTNVPSDRNKSDTEPQADEFVQLYFNEAAFLSAYVKNGKLNMTGRPLHQKELSAVLEKMRQFAHYRVPILGRANQRRVAGCPECLKPFNHGFTDLKKHLLVAHLGLKRDIIRFAIEFTHSGRSITSTNSSGAGVVAMKRSPDADSGISRGPKYSFAMRASRTHVMKNFKKRTFGFPNLHGPGGRRIIGPTATNNGEDHSSKSRSPIPLATVAPDGLPTLVSSPSSSYTGGAPVHRIIPGTGISDRYEDMKSLDEVAREAPIGRGGIIPLDELDRPLGAAVVAASQPQSPEVNGGSELFLPKVGKQRIQLAYSYPVFKRLLEAYQVPMAERIQLVNRMNHYARQYVIMELLVPGGAQKRFSCPTCMYTSVHSLADIRKHIMGSHCGISTKRFRLCLRASRHDITTYRLHTDERMIRFVEDHRRRQIQGTSEPKTNSTSGGRRSSVVDNHTHHATDRSLELVPNGITTVSKSGDRNPGLTNTNLHEEQLETDTIEADQYTEDYDEEQSEMLDASDRECDRRFLKASSRSPSPSAETAIAIANDILNVHSNETQRQPGEVYRRIELPFSTHVLRVLMERESLLDQYDDILERMNYYSRHHLTVVSRGGRICSYICVCGRRFLVVREELDTDIRPASLADCRRHILGVHARVPQELLTLCCQASRISKESGYRLYSDNSLLALAEQYKFRTSRTSASGTRLSEEGLSPSVRTSEAAGTDDRWNSLSGTQDVRSPPSGISTSTAKPNPVSNHNAPSQVALRQTNYAATRSLPPMHRAPKLGHDIDSPTRYDEDHNSVTSRNTLKSSLTKPLTDNGESIKSETQPTNQCSANRHSGLDLDAPRRILTTEEAVLWRAMLDLPESWTLERIVRLAYSPELLDEQLQSTLPIENGFIETLHERMRVYSRHSVYIIRLCTSTNPNQRLYVCCACLTTSQHGFGDVRKHILGVHAHVPERFKALAMNASRLSREDYSLNTSQLSSQSSSAQSAVTKKNKSKQTNSSSPSSGCELTVGSRVLRRRRCSMESNTSSSPYSFSASQSVPRKRHRGSLDTDPEQPFSPTAVIDHSPHDPPCIAVPINGHASGSLSYPDRVSRRDVSDVSRPPIILTIPRPKAFISESDSGQSSPTDMQKLEEGLSSAEASSEVAVPSSGSRSRRSMILKSKRPCPTSS
ncbi:hypothetical protein FGIG_00884 [Fasciola gigantica]|uniref:C2H2-type domain-containing protein n=1 Tax=Fasciola gigantica TaxID=46835 RepID=A0A504YI82_FASGI|nr:hypothetical protein FGIG_00884 [Fasciola gigantica]